MLFVTTRKDVGTAGEKCQWNAKKKKDFKNSLGRSEKRSGRVNAETSPREFRKFEKWTTMETNPEDMFLKRIV